MTADLRFVYEAWAAAEPRRLAYEGCWVMDRQWYDRIRALAWTEDQEEQRAAAHANLFINADAEPPLRCPVCPSGPFDDFRGLCEHVRLMSDPKFKDPDPNDTLLGLRMIVRPDGGKPHVEDAFSHPHPLVANSEWRRCDRCAHIRAHHGLSGCAACDCTVLVL